MAEQELILATEKEMALPSTEIALPPKRPLIKAGWHKNLSNEDYHASSGASSSVLKKLAKKTGAHLDYDRRHPKKPSDAMKSGTLLHLLVLEPENFYGEYIMKPPGLKRPTDDNYASAKPTKATIAKIDAWEDLEREAAGREIITEEFFDKANAMAEAVLSHETAAQLLESKLAEQSVYWWYNNYDPDCDLDFKQMHKVRADALLYDYDFCVDLKSCRDGSHDGFVRSVLDYGYHISAAMYLDGINQCQELLDHLGHMAITRFVFICVESDGEHEVSIYDMQARDEFMEIGRSMYHRLARKYKQSKDAGWPGFPLEGRKLDPPSWANNLWTV